MMISQCEQNQYALSTRDSSQLSRVLRAQLCHQPTFIPLLLVLIQFCLHKVMQHLDLLVRHGSAIKHGQWLDRCTSILCNLADLSVPVHADDDFAVAHILLGQVGINQDNLTVVVVGKGDAKGMVLHGELDGFSLPDIVDGDVFTLDTYIGAAEMLKCGDEGDATGVYEVAVVVEDVDISANGETFAPCYYAEGFSV